MLCTADEGRTAGGQHHPRARALCQRHPVQGATLLCCRQSTCLLLSTLPAQVGVEFVGPALLLLAWSTLLLGSWASGAVEGRRHSTAGEGAVQPLWAASALWEFVGGFMAWWTCACLASSTLLTVLLHRLGFLVV